MDTLREEQVYEALRAVKDPDLKKDIVALGFVKNLRIDKRAISLDIDCNIRKDLRLRCAGR